LIVSSSGVSGFSPVYSIFQELVVASLLMTTLPSPPPALLAAAAGLARTWNCKPHQDQQHIQKRSTYSAADNDCMLPAGEPTRENRADADFRMRIEYIFSDVRTCRRQEALAVIGTARNTDGDDAWSAISEKPCGVHKAKLLF
jgi:hypothetical protein